MYGPHGYGCESTTWKTKCQVCFKDVYRLSCNHGSVVWFDELGEPWEKHKHDCRPSDPDQAEEQGKRGRIHVLDARLKVEVEVLAVRVHKGEKLYRIRPVAGRGVIWRHEQAVHFDS